VQQPDSQEASNKTKDAREPTSLRQCSWYNRQRGLLPADPSRQLDGKSCKTTIGFREKK
jgi:hypothetical protein